MNNKDALRWCKTRRATVQFDDWKKIKRKVKGVPDGVSCCVSLGEIFIIDKTLIKTVQKWIDEVEKGKKDDRAQNLKDKRESEA